MRAILDPLPRRRRFALNDSDRPMNANGWTKDQIDDALVNMDEWHFHDLRRSFASGCARLGVTPHVIERALNHKLGGVAGIYNKHQYEIECRAAWELWSNHVEKLTNIPNE